jgi:hypothetical protein
MFCLLLLSTATLAQNPVEETEPASKSLLTSIALPAHAQRMKSVPEPMKQSLAEIMKGSGQPFKPGNTEVLAWRPPHYAQAKASQFIGKVRGALEKAGWTVQLIDEGTGFQVMTALHQSPPRGVLGIWVPAEDALILSWAEMSPESAPAGRVLTGESGAAAPAPRPAPAPAPSNSGTPSGAITFDLGAGTGTLNLMKNALPKLPSFPSVAPKPGFARGYVKDSTGKPLKGATVGARSSATGGWYSGGNGTTDEKGYYEFSVPLGAAEFYAAGYTLSYGEGRVAMGLYPADGEASQFASNVGGVENWVLVPYGVADPDAAQDDPRDSNNYFGGHFVLSWSGGDVPENATVEVVLTPQGSLIDGSSGPSFVIRKNTGTSSTQLYVNNVPAAVYRFEARLAGGGPLKIREVGPMSAASFGLEPKEGMGSVTLQLRPKTAKAGMATAGKGTWGRVSIELSQ